MTIEERLSDARERRPSLDADEALRLVRCAHRRRQRTRRGTAAAVLAAGAVVAALGIGLGPLDDQSTDVATDGSQPDGDPTLELRGGWTELAGSPLSPRVGAAAAATEEEFVIWGGRAYQPLGDGAAYDFRAGTWRVMSGSPLPPQADAVAVWTGSEAVFWGRSGEGGTTVDEVAAAAAWNPATNGWRAIPNQLGLGASRTLTGAAWTGSEIILVGVSGPANAFLATNTFAVDPTSGDLRSMEPTPRPASPEYRPRGRTAFVVGDELLLVTVADGFPVTIDRLDIETGRWAPTVETHMPGLNVSSDAAVWTGARLVIANHLGAGAVFDPADGQLQEIPSSNSLHRFPAVAVTADIVSVGDRFLKVSAGQWNNAESIPDPVREFPVAVGFAGAMYVWGGDACGPAASCLGIVDPGPGLVWAPPGTHDDPVSTPSPRPGG